MKACLLILLATLPSFEKPGQEPIDRIGVKGPLTFNNTTFNLTWTNNPNDNYYIQKYLPDSENVDRFNQMISIFLLVSGIKTKDAVQEKINELKARKKIDPTCNYMVNQSPDRKEYLVDFLLGESKNNKMEVEEFNVYRYKQTDLGDNKKGILVFAYSKRAYGDDIIPFFTNLNSDRVIILNAMIDVDIPSITIAAK